MRQAAATADFGDEEALELSEVSSESSEDCGGRPMAITLSGVDFEFFVDHAADTGSDSSGDERDSSEGATVAAQDTAASDRWESGFESSVCEEFCPQPGIARDLTLSGKDFACFVGSQPVVRQSVKASSQPAGAKAKLAEVSAPRQQRWSLLAGLPTSWLLCCQAGQDSTAVAEDIKVLQVGEPSLEAQAMASYGVAPYL